MSHHGMRNSAIAIVLISLLFCLGANSKALPDFIEIETNQIEGFNEGKVIWQKNNGYKLIYYTKTKKSFIKDPLGNKIKHNIITATAYVIQVKSAYYLLNSKKYGIRIWNDTVYYFNKAKDHTNSGWFRKFGRGMTSTGPPKNFDESRLDKYFNVVLQYEYDSLIQTQANVEVKNIWKLPDGLIYISQPGLGIAESESFNRLIKRLEGT